METKRKNNFSYFRYYQNKLAINDSVSVTITVLNFTDKTTSGPFLLCLIYQAVFPWILKVSIHWNHNMKVTFKAIMYKRGLLEMLSVKQ